MEDEILTRVDLYRVLDRLHPADRLMMLLIYRIERPDDWCAAWPPRYEDIGCYIGEKFQGQALSEAAIRYRRDAVKAMWAGERGELRRKPVRVGRVAVKRCSNRPKSRKRGVAR